MRGKVPFCNYCHFLESPAAFELNLRIGGNRGRFDINRAADFNTIHQKHEYSWHSWKAAKTIKGSLFNLLFRNYTGSFITETGIFYIAPTSFLKHYSAI